MGKKRRRRYRKKEGAPSKVVWVVTDNSGTGQGATPSDGQKPSKKARVGRLRWTCLTCLELGTPDTKVVRRACSLHGAGDHVKRVRV